MNEERTIPVPVKWLESLTEYAERVRKQIDELPDEDHTVLIKTDISALVGYASSARTVLNNNKKQ
jgi:hypothetical protein